MRAFLIAVIGVLLLSHPVGAEHKVTFSQTNNQTGGIAILGVATNTFDGTHDPAGVKGRATNNDGMGVWGEVTGDAQYGVYGDANATTAPNANGVRGRAGTQSFAAGVAGVVSSYSGYGVHGDNFATNACPRGCWHAAGVEGRSRAAHGIGVFGWNTSSTGNTVGVKGEATSSLAGIGVWGKGPGTLGYGYGVRGEAGAAGVFGSGASTGVQGFGGLRGMFALGPTGIIGRSSSNDGGVGVQGETIALTGAAVAVSGQTAANAGTGVKGNATAASGDTVGVRGSAASTAGRGVVGEATATSGTTYGVLGISNSPDGSGIRGVGDNGAAAGTFKGDVRIVSGGHLYVHGNHIADLAEDMPVAGRVSPGDVVVLTPQGYAVARATRAYDTGVAGIVSVAPRLHLAVGGRSKMVPVGLVGIVRAKASATNGAIRPRDLLTTSHVPGHLMRCPVAIRCVGAIVGKALQPLAKGEGQILVLLWRQ